MSGRARRPVVTAAVAVMTAAGSLVSCRGEEAGQGRPAASPAAGPATTAAAVLAELPVPRTEVVGAVWSGALAVAGGLTADGAASALLHTYDAEDARWDPAPPLPVPLHHAAMAVVGERLHVVGGYTNGPGEPWRPVASMWSLGPDDPAWREEPPMPAGPRGALGAAAAGGLLVVAGGESGGAVLARTEVYEPGRRAWVAGPDLARPREHLAVATAGERVYAIAGRAGSLANFRAVQSLDPRIGGAWRDEAELGDSRGGTAAAAVGGRLCVAGGEEEAGTIASVECLDGDRWVRAGRLARPRHGVAAMALDGRLHVVAGGERPGLFVSGAHEALDL